MGHARTTPQICKDCGSVKVRGSHNKFKCISEECAAKRKAYAQQYRKDNKQDLLEKRREYVSNNRDAVDAYQQQYRKDHKEDLAAWGRKHREENKKAIAIQRAGYREANRELINDRQKDYYQRNREERLEYAKEFRDEKMAPYYKIWDAIVQRTTNPNSQAWDNYGGRNIRMYEPWQKDYKVFEIYMNDHLGPKPTPDHSIDRINNEGHYEPGNLKWSTQKEQIANQRNSLNKKVKVSDDATVYYEDKYITLKEFSDVTGLPLLIVKYRYNHFPDSDYILHWKNDNRSYELEGHFYNIAELSLLFDVKYNVLFEKLNKLGWSVEKAVELNN